MIGPDGDNVILPVGLINVIGAGNSVAPAAIEAWKEKSVMNDATIKLREKLTGNASAI